MGSRGDGDRPLVVSYASSPPAEVIYSDDPAAGAVTGAIVADNMCFRQIEYAGVLEGAANQAGAEQFIDFMLSAEFQADLPLNMFRLPGCAGHRTAGRYFVEYAAIPANPASLDPARIETKRDEWIQAWAEVMLR